MNGNYQKRTDELKSGFLKEWWDTSAEFPAFDRVYSRESQKSAERKMDLIVDQMLAEVKVNPGSIQKDYSAWGSRMRNLLGIIFDDVLELGRGSTEILLRGGYCKVTSDFIDKARSFDPSIKTADILQAMRNIWIMNCIQVLSGREVEFTPALFAYSMLYPYTDNFLDSVDVSLGEKLRYAERFKLILEGKPVESKSPFEVKIFRLVGMIESQYGRDGFPQVYESLLAIHDAQQKSLNQQSGLLSPYESDIPGVSFGKGGSSVLADAFLVNGHLSDAQERFMFGFGIFLQLADDAQDVGIDFKNRHMTMFSQIAGKWNLDSVMNKLLNFMFSLIDYDKCFNSSRMIEQKRLIRSGCTLLLISAAANNTPKYGKSYLKKLEKHSPFSFDYLRRLYKRAGKEFNILFEKNDTVPIDSIIARALSV
ncbi:MAG: hypothetical protein FIA99_00715 [Ruminiclostridium sp.]|nr:hypothetical protein [Ruminiclostridium sp.]